MPSTTPPLDPPYAEDDSILSHDDTYEDEQFEEESYVHNEDEDDDENEQFEEDADEELTIHATGASSSSRARTGSASAASATSGREPNPLLDPEAALVTPLEQNILDEYTRLLDNMNNVRKALLLGAGSPVEFGPKC